MFLKNDRGFTLVEVIIAIGVFSIGVFATLMLQTTFIKGNANSQRIGDATNWGADRMEMLLSMPYDSHNNGRDDDGDGDTDEADEAFLDGAGTDDGVAGLDNSPAKRSGDPDDVPDNSVVSPNGQYTVYWNVAQDYPETDMKTVRVIVRNNYLFSDSRLTTIKISGR